MNSKLKGIIVCGVFVVCLGVVALVLSLMPKEEEKPADDQSSSQTTVTEKTTPIVDFDKAQVKHILIENQYGTLNLTQTSSGGNTWTVDELEGIEQNETITSAAAQIASTLSYVDIVEEDAADLSKYGLAEPQSTFTTEFADYDKTVKTFLIGNESPKSGYYYVCEKDTTKVYTVNGTGLRYFLYKAEDFVDLTVMNNPEDTENWPEIVDLAVKRSDLDYEIRFRTVEEEESIVSTQIMYEPITMALNITYSSEVTHGMWGLEASQAVKVFPGEEDMAKYGLDDPSTVVTLVLPEEETYVLSIGSPVYALDESGNETKEVAGYYLYITGEEGKDVIFLAEASVVPWPSFKPEDVMTTVMIYHNIKTVDSVTIESGAEKYEMDLIGDGDDAPTKVTVNGKEVEVDLFKSLYQQIITCPTNEIYFEKTENDPYLTLTLKVKDGAEEVLTFVKETDRRTIVLLNGEPQFRIASTWTEVLLENVQNLIDGKEIKDFV